MEATHPPCEMSRNNLGSDSRYAALKRRGTKLVLWSAGLCALALLLWGGVQMGGWTGYPSGSISTIEVPQDIKATIQEDGESQLGEGFNEFAYGIEKISKVFSILISIPVILIAITRHSLMSFAVGMTLSLSIYTLPGLIPSVVGAGERDYTPREALAHAVEEADYTQLAIWVEQANRTRDQQARYILAQAAVISGDEQAAHEARRFWEVRNTRTGPLDIEQQRSYALDLAAYGEPTHAGSEAYLIETARKGVIGKRLTYFAGLLGIVGMAVGLVGASILRRIKRLGKLSRTASSS